MAIDMRCDNCDTPLDPYGHLSINVFGTNTGQLEFCLDCAAPILQMEMVDRVLSERAPEPMPWKDEEVEPTPPSIVEEE